jgi:hypothetical protein
MRLVSRQPCVIFCATFALRSRVFPNRDHFHQEKSDRALPSDDLSS